MKDDLISRQAAIDHLKKRLYETALNNNTEHPYYEEMADNRVSVWIEELPTIDPVKHGRWLKTEAFPHHVYCSECNNTYIPNDRLQIWTDGDLPRKYCPNCGAKMDMEGK